MQTVVTVVCLVRAAMVSNADNSDMDIWDDAMPVPAAFSDSDDENDFEGF